MMWADLMKQARVFKYGLIALLAGVLVVGHGIVLYRLSSHMTRAIVLGLILLALLNRLRRRSCRRWCLVGSPRRRTGHQNYRDVSGGHDQTRNVVGYHQLRHRFGAARRNAAAGRDRGKRTKTVGHRFWDHAHPHGHLLTMRLGGPRRSSWHIAAATNHCHGW